MDKVVVFICACRSARNIRLKFSVCVKYMKLAFFFGDTSPEIPKNHHISLSLPQKRFEIHFALVFLGLVSPNLLSLVLQILCTLKIWVTEIIYSTEPNQFPFDSTAISPVLGGILAHNKGRYIQSRNPPFQKGVWRIPNFERGLLKRIIYRSKTLTFNK